MKIEQNTISRDWTVLHNGQRFFVNFTESDGQTLALCNRDNWEITEETEDGVEEVSAYVFKDSDASEQRQAEENAGVIEKLIAFCMENWDNEFRGLIAGSVIEFFVAICEGRSKTVAPGGPKL